MRWFVLLTVVVGMAVVAPAANAYYFASQGLAEHYARQVLHASYYGSTGVSCDPSKGRNERSAKNRSYWHRWSCYFYVGDPGASCKGNMSIRGTDDGSGFYYHRNWSVGETC